MLVLGRKVGETIKIGNDIYITIERIDPIRQQARIGITAPQHVSIVRLDERGTPVPYKRGEE